MDVSIYINKTFTILSSTEMIFTGQFLFSAILALIFGYIIGWERRCHEKPAGIVTHSFVILGALIFTMLSTIGRGDPSRIAAQIVTGVGFLGAGMILKGDDKVENLTTAAGLWVSAAIGMALGYKMYLMAFMAVIMMVFARFLPYPNDDEKK